MTIPLAIILALLALLSGCARQPDVAPQEYQSEWVFDFELTKQVWKSLPGWRKQPHHVETALEGMKGVRLKVGKNRNLHTKTDDEGNVHDLSFHKVNFRVIHNPRLLSAVPDTFGEDYLMISYYEDLEEEMKAAEEGDYSGIDANIKVYTIFLKDGSRYLAEYLMYFVDGAPDSLWPEYMIYREQ